MGGVVAVEDVGVMGVDAVVVGEVVVMVDVGVLAVAEIVEAVVVGVFGIGGGSNAEGECRLPRKRLRARSRSCSIC